MVRTSAGASQPLAARAAGRAGSVVAARVSETSTPSVPLARMFQAPSRPGCRQREPQHVDPRPRPDERQQHREDHERQLDHGPAQDPAGRDPGHRPHRGEHQQVPGEHAERLPRRRHHAHRAEQRGDDLHLGGEAVHGRRARQVQRVGVARPHRGSAPVGAGARPAARPVAGSPQHPEQQPGEQRGHQDPDDTGEPGRATCPGDGVAGERAAGRVWTWWRSARCRCRRARSPAAVRLTVQPFSVTESSPSGSELARYDSPPATSSAISRKPRRNRDLRGEVTTSPPRRAPARPAPVARGAAGTPGPAGPRRPRPRWPP